MSRRARPWFRAGRSMFYFQFQGKQIPTGVTDPADVAGAQAAMEQILADLVVSAAGRLRPPDPPPSTNTNPADGRTVADAVTGYLEACGRKAERGKLLAESLRNYRRALEAFAAAFGTRTLASFVAAVEPGADDPAAAVSAWADRDDWSASYRHGVLSTVQAMFRHYRIVLPVEKPAKESRGADCVLTEGQFAAVLAEATRYAGAKGDLVPLLKALRETGARPQEVARLHAADVDWENGCTRLKKHKTKAKTGRDRVIHFNAAAAAVLAAQRLKHGDGLLFRTRAGGAYTAGAIVRRMGQISKRVGFRAIAYGLGRHSFATRALAAGIPDAVVAELLGHRGTAMLQFHYSHLGSQARVLKDAAERASAPAAPKAG